MKYLLSIISTAAVAAAHGFVDNATIDGVDYQFYQPYQDPYMNPAPQRISRPIQGNGPVEDLTISDIQCGGYAAGGVAGSSPAALHAPATAGSKVTLRWTLWPESHVGPVITYMAACPASGCNDYQPESDAVWFKVQEGGRDGTSNNWAATPLMKAGAEVEYTIPECLKPGYYLVRHEIIALHAAYAYPGAQFYPGCHQLEVSGSGSTVPSDLVSFPGAYGKADAGIVYDAYQASTYTIPGPALFSCSGAGSGSGSAPVASSPAASAPAASAPAASAPAASSVEAIASSVPVSTPVATPAPTTFATRVSSAVSAPAASSNAVVTDAAASLTSVEATTPTELPAEGEEDEEEDC